MQKTEAGPGLKSIKEHQVPSVSTFDLLLFDLPWSSKTVAAYAQNPLCLRFESSCQNMFDLFQNSP
jgi:hypothetical protein